MEQRKTLARLRVKKGLSQKEVAKELGVTRQAVSGWESGRTRPSVEKLVAVCRLYGVPVEELCREWVEEAVEEEISPVEEAEENVPEADTSPKKGSTGKKKLVLPAVLALTYVLVYTAGILTRSRSMATSTLFLLTAVIALIWALFWLRDIFKKGYKDNEKNSEK